MSNNNNNNDSDNSISITEIVTTTNNNIITCNKCCGNRINKKGKQQYNQKQRYFCRDCGNIWTEGKDERKKYSDDFKFDVIKLYLENVGLRTISRLKNNISASLISKWIKSYGKIVQDKLEIAKNNIINNNIEILEIDEIVTYVKKNLKILKQEKKETSHSYGLLLIGTKIILLDLK